MANQPGDVVERLHSEKRREEHEKEKQKTLMQSLYNQGKAWGSFGWSNSMFIWRGSTLEKGDGDKKKRRNKHFWCNLFQVRGKHGLLWFILFCINVSCIYCAVCSSPVVFLLRREGPGDIQSMNFPHRDDCKHTDTQSEKHHDGKMSTSASSIDIPNLWSIKT